MADFEIGIDSLASGGDGVGRAPDGRVVFVPFTAPGDRVRVRIVSDRGRYVRATALEVVAPGAGRTDPLCSVFGSCGGCAWQHLAYETQLAAKERILRDALQRIAGLRLHAHFEMQPCPEPYGYRSRARVLVRRGRTGFRRRRSHVVCATARCPILLPALDEALAGLAQRGPGPDAEWILSAGDDGEVLIAAAGAGVSGSKSAIQVGDDRLRVSPDAFVQGNALLRAELARAVLRTAGFGERALELFAGAGFFTLGLSRNFAELVVVEANPHAVADLEANLAEAGRHGVRVIAAPIEQALRHPLLEAFTPEVVVLDPPRVGLASGLHGALAGLGARRLVYLSCDPATLARDLGLLVDRGYELTALAGFDLFPQTPHVESLAVLEAA